MKSTQEFIEERQRAHNRCEEVQALDNKILELKDILEGGRSMGAKITILPEDMHFDLDTIVTSKVQEYKNILIEKRESM